MEQDQDMLYDDEQDMQEQYAQEPSEEASDIDDPEEDESVNDMRYFLKLLYYMQEALDFGTSVPLTTKKLVDTDKCMLILRDMEDNLPDAIQYGQKLYAERDRILSTAENTAMNRVASADVRAKSVLEEASARARNMVANAEQRAANTLADAEERANAMIEDATARAEQMVDESEIMARAREEARLLIEDARTDANDRRLKAVNDAYRLFDALEKQTIAIADQLHKKRDELSGGNR